VISPKTTPKSLTPCQNLRVTALHVAEYVPECDPYGGFKKQQCTVDSVNKRKYCWCVDPHGVEIGGTRLVFPKMPDCDFGECSTGCHCLVDALVCRASNILAHNTVYEYLKK